MKRRHIRKTLSASDLVIVYTFMFFAMLISALLPIYLNTISLLGNNP
jgi:hypothetical protein